MTKGNSIKALSNRLYALENTVKGLISNNQRDNEPQPIDVRDESSHEPRDAPRNAPIIPPAPQNTYKSQSAKGNPFPWWKLAEAIGIAAAVIVALVNIEQWREMHHNFTLDERAWMRVNPDLVDKFMNTFDVRSTSNLMFPMEVVNVGKSAALRITIGTSAEVRKLSERPSFSYTRSTGVTTGVDFPSVPIKLEGGWQSITEPERQELIAGDSYLVLYGRIQYDDIFGIHHETKYCGFKGFVAGRVANAKSCTDYNSTDAN